MEIENGRGGNGWFTLAVAMLCRRLSGVRVLFQARHGSRELPQRETLGGFRAIILYFIIFLFLTYDISGLVQKKHF